ncbi:MAG: ankyrin repeat domain-containing protein [Candidatus Eremiobacteraeota bacterium]|nr:ankyrin repeat domain-containing protein [Candidatus Eremiobacteraeota bacterium]
MGHKFFLLIMIAALSLCSCGKGAKAPPQTPSPAGTGAFSAPTKPAFSPTPQKKATSSPQGYPTLKVTPRLTPRATRTPAKATPKPSLSPTPEETIFKAIDPQEIIEAVLEGNTDRINRLLEDDPDLVEARDEQDYSLLHMAAWRGDIRIVEALINRKADPNLRNKWGFSALHELVRCEENNERRNILELMITAGGEVNALTDYGNTPLDIASIQGKSEFVRILQAYGATRGKHALNLPPLPAFAKKFQ